MTDLLRIRGQDLIAINLIIISISFDIMAEIKYIINNLVPCCNALRYHHLG